MEKMSKSSMDNSLLAPISETINEVDDADDNPFTDTYLQMKKYKIGKLIKQDDYHQLYEATCTFDKELPLVVKISD